MFKRACALLLVATALSGCGGGRGITDHLFTLRPGSRWVYKLTGNVTLPNGNKQGVKDGSTLTVEMLNFTVRDANNTEINILDRKYNITLLDGTVIVGHQRLYVSQTSQGIFVHGFNNFVGDNVNPDQDKFVPAAASPPFKFVYLPDPAADNTSVTYNNPFSATATGSYSLQITTPRQPVQVPAGDFRAKPLTLRENFSSFALTSTGFVPEVGIVAGVISAILPDGTRIGDGTASGGVISLSSYRL